MILKLKNVLILIITGILCFAALELAFRLIRAKDTQILSMGQVDARYHHSLKINNTYHLISSIPGEYNVLAHTNRYGFRGRDFDIEKSRGLKRIFLVGDSFTFGVGCQDEETVAVLLQNLLSSKNQSFEIINAGIPSYSPLTHYIKLRDDIPKFKPDLVVMLLDFSDLRDDWDVEKNLIYDQAGKIVGANPYYENGRFHFWNFLRTKSILCKYLHDKIVRTFRKIRQLGLVNYIRIRVEGKRAKAVIAYQSGDTIEYDGRLFMRGETKADEIRKHFARTAKYILMNRDLAQANGAQFVLVMYPYGIYVGADQWNEGRIFWGFEKNKVYTDYFAFDLVRKFAASNQIPFVNLLDDFIQNRDKRLFFPYDGHFTPEGNRVAAEGLAKNPVFQETLEHLS